MKCFKHIEKPSIIIELLLRKSSTSFLRVCF